MPHRQTDRHTPGDRLGCTRTTLTQTKVLITETKRRLTEHHKNKNNYLALSLGKHRLTYTRWLDKLHKTIVLDNCPQMHLVRAWTLAGVWPEAEQFGCGEHNSSHFCSATCLVFHAACICIPPQSVSVTPMWHLFVFRHSLQLKPKPQI